ncbi:MAG: Rossmann-like fold-containing protein [Fervidobacterium sp.]|uniref:tRNA1(Val) A37 N6-methylase TrmN6 n=1 Tax=Fervidobacterium gondwanense DSM 13020 TaxID=1121883 RepID=A0A1M7RXQ7_FERGO|nr:Rossmann-like fold-containing protein [Fervidobacterium gondwanense]UXF00102.1 methyltransferase [Fervidobacterium riparium]SHN51083.1 tRNA1(Val) A37 N6-methylase TrmN6 [Fervidobacterium gondwanense DSM 13020]
MNEFLTRRFSSEILRGIETIDLPTHRPTHASAFLVWYSKPTADVKRVVELGSGTGIVAFALAKLYNLYVEGIEVQKELFDLAVDGIKINGLEDKVVFRNIDVRDIRSNYNTETFDMVVSNLPFHIGKESPNKIRKISRNADYDLLKDFIHGASYLIRNKGTFVFAFSPKILVEMITLLEKQRLIVQRMCFLHGTPEKEAKLVVVRGKKNGGKHLIVDPPQWGV